MSDAVREIAERVARQDNRATAFPIFAVQQRVRDCGYDPQWADDGRTVWLDVANDSEEATPEQAAMLDAGDLDPDDGWIKTGYRDRWEFVQPFFSEIGAKAYIAANGHNLTDPRVYVYSAYRNREWQAVVQDMLQERDR